MKANIIYELEAVIVSFLEIKDTNEPFFMKRKFKNENVAKIFIEKLLTSGRKVANVQYKVNYNIKKEEN